MDSLSKRRPRQNIISMILAKGSSVCSSASSRSSWTRGRNGEASMGVSSYSSANSRDILRSAVELTRQSQRKLATSISSRSKSKSGRGKAGHFIKGQRAFYRSTKGIVKVTIVGVHHDSKLVPYYTIQLRDGSEKQSDGKHLTPLLDHPSVSKSLVSKSGGGSRNDKEGGGSRSKSQLMGGVKGGDDNDHSDSLTDEHMTESSSEGCEIRGGSKLLEDSDEGEPVAKGVEGRSQPREMEGDGGEEGGVGGRGGSGTESSSEGDFWGKLKRLDKDNDEPSENEDNGGEKEEGVRGGGSGIKKFHVGQYVYYRPPDSGSVIKVRIVRHSRTKDLYAVSLPDGSHQENIKPSQLATLMELSSNEMIALMKEGNKENLAERPSKVDRGLRKSEEETEAVESGGEENEPRSFGLENSKSLHHASSNLPPLSASLPVVATASPPQPTVRMVQAKTEDGKWKTVPLYESGMIVNYTNAEGTQSGTVLTVHLDDLMEPYYTVLLQDGKEKQTDNAHISIRVEDQHISHPHDAKEDDAKRGHQGEEEEEEETPPVPTRSSSKNRPKVERINPSAESTASPITYIAASFFENDQVLYKSSDGECQRAVVVKLQRDKKNRPYYVVRLLATGKEKLVYGHRLQPLVHEDDRNNRCGRSKSVSSSEGQSHESGRERGRSASKASKSPESEEYRDRGESRPSHHRSESLNSHRSKRSVSRESTHTTLSNSSRRSQVKRDMKNAIPRDDPKAPSLSRRDESLEPISRRRGEGSLTPSISREGRRERTDSSLRGRLASDPVGTSRSRSSSVRRYFGSSNADSRRTRELSRSRAPSQDSRRSSLSNSTRSQDSKLSNSRGYNSSGNDRSSIPTIPTSVKKTFPSDTGRRADANTTAISKLKSFRKSFAQLSKSAK